ncbi:hypothetical protein KBI52_23120 [Microvirga sp. HBU67558]|uniref:calcium-binding protein n=1 Tax=Microvirga TaxID=186650 RepID=UPI001B3943B3|nr:calcium-binding protein [Microvirga sp. HBU67655]MBQ0823084.1 hypothetical protein [Microvirga sp. HBU67558]
MTVYVIDASSPVPPSTEDYDVALALERNDTVVLAEGSSITASGYGSRAITGLDNTLLLNGSVRSEQDVAISTSGRINISGTGSVFGLSGGLWLGDPIPGGGGANIVTNAGLISGKSKLGAGTAVLLETHAGTQNTIFNSGTIIGSDGIVANGYDTDTDSLVITNTGLIEGVVAIFGLWNGSTTVTNTGHIKGDVWLGGDGWNEPRGASTNIYDGRGGTIDGKILFGAGNDIAYGGDGDETFVTGPGTNFLDAGEGVDTLGFTRGDYYRLAWHKVDLRITGKQQTGNGTWDTIRNVENLTGAHNTDHFIGNDAANSFTGLGGNDTLDGQAGNDVLRGGAHDDVLIGGSGTDVAVYGGNFSDYTVQRKADGSFSVVDNRTGDGQDTLTGIEYAQFADRTIALTASNSAPTSVSLDVTTVSGRAKAGAVVGHLSGTDPDGDALGYFLASNPNGHFRIQGDELIVAKPFTAGETTVELVVRASDPKGASIDARIILQITPDGIVPVAPDVPAIDTPTVPLPSVSLPPASVTVRGSRGADRLKGGAGDDVLNGGLGRDKLSGGDGSDTFVFSTKLGKTNVDTLTDFSGVDTIRLSKAVFGALHRGLLDESAFGLGAKAANKDVRILYDAKTGNLFYDADGSGNAFDSVKFAHVKVHTAIVAGDFIVA